MSKYFQALNKIAQQGQMTEQDRVRLPAKELKTSYGAESSYDTIVHVPDLSSANPAKHRRAYSELLDSLRATVGSLSVPSVVIAGASGARASSYISDGLQSQAREIGVRLLALELCLDGTRRFLREREVGGPAAGSRQGSFEQSAQRDIGGSNATLRKSVSQVESWLTNAESNFDLATIQAPPLSESVEAAIIARECDGLVIVVESFKDSVADVVSAVDKAREADCRVFGFVLTGAREWLPRWLGRLFRSSVQPIGG